MTVANEPGAERRRYDRIAADEHAAARVIAPLLSELFDVRIVNIGQGGLMLFARERLSPQSVVQVRVRGTFILGEVRHAIPKDGGWYAGIEVQDLLTIPIVKSFVSYQSE